MTADWVRDLSFAEYLELIRAFTDDELIPGEAAMVAEGAVPAELLGRLAELGLFGITLPRRWGGLGWSVEEQVLLTFEFTRASCVYRSRFSTTIGLASQVLVDHGTDGQRERWLPAMAEGACVTAFALTEEGAGSDASAVATTARRTADGWILDGAKRYITNGAWCDLLLVFAATQDQRGRPTGMSVLVVPADTPGVHATPATAMNGHAEGPVAELRFSEVRLPPDALVGGVEGRGLAMAMRGINHARTHVAATAVGQATRLLDLAARHAATRRQFGRPVGDFGTIEAMLGASYAELRAGRALALECARAFTTGAPPHHEIAAAKYFCTEMVGRVADRAVQILGGEGIVGDHPVPRLWRDVRALRIYEGTSQIHERNLGRFVQQPHRPH